MIALRRRTQQLTWVVLIGLLVAAFCFAQDGGDTPSAPEPPGQAEPAPAPTADDPPAPAPEPTPEPTPSEPDPTPEPVDEPAPEPESSDEADPGGPTPEDDAGGDPTDPVTDEEPATPGDPVDGEPSADGDEATEPTDEGGEAVVEGTDPAETEAADTDEPPAGEPADAAPTATVAPQPPPAKSQPPAREERPRKRTRVGPPPRPVSREVEKQRDETVQKSLEVLATPVDETSEVSDADRMAALSELSRQARMQLSALQTERSQFEAEHRRVHEIAEELENDGRRMPTLISTSKLPLMYAEDAQEWADETVADMNALFDETLSRRTELAQSLERYRSELADARQSAEALQGGPLTPVWDSALQVLADREEAASELVELFDKLVGETVDASEAGSQLSLDLNKAIQISLPRRLSARTATPIGGATFTATKDELTGLLGQARGAKQEATASIQSANMPVSGALSLVLLALAVTGWVLVPRVPGRILSQCDPHEGASGHLLRATRLLVPVGRFVVLIALWAGLIQAWGFDSGWALAGLAMLAAWAAYFLLIFGLRELMAPNSPQFRLLNIGDQVAKNGCCILRAVAFATALLLPIIGLLGTLEKRPAETIRVLQVIYGGGLLLICYVMTRRAGGLRAVLPRPETPDKTPLQQVGRLLVPLSAAGVLVSVVAAASGYTNLSAFLSRSVALELLLVFGVLFVDHLILGAGEKTQAIGWRVWSRRALWAAALLAQIPIWRLHAYHASYAASLLKRSIISVQGAEVTPLSILKGLVLIVIVYLVGRAIRTRVQNWRGLQERFQAGVIYALSNLAFYVILAGGVIWGILASGFQLSVLTVFAGMAGIGLGFGLQDIVGNFVSGLILLIERPAAVGDFVDLGDLQGTIKAINLRSTAIRTRDGNLVLVPNSDLAASRLTNFTISDPKLRVRVSVGVSYDTDLSKVYAILERVAEEDPDVLSDPAPIIRLTGFGDNSVDFELLAWVASPDIMEDVGPVLRRRIWDAFLDENIEIPFPQRDLHVRSSDIDLLGHEPAAEE